MLYKIFCVCWVHVRVFLKFTLDTKDIFSFNTSGPCGFVEYKKVCQYEVRYVYQLNPCAAGTVYILFQANAELN